MKTAKEKKNILLMISGVLTIVIMAVMNLYLLPTIEQTTQGIRFFDMNSFGYSYEQACQLLSLLSEKGRYLALHIQLPLDFIYPISYTTFFILLMEKLSKKRGLWVVPILLFVSDYIENICSVKMLNAQTLSETLAGFASAVTVFKSVMMVAAFAIILVLFILWLKKRKKSN